MICRALRKELSVCRYGSVPPILPQSSEAGAITTECQISGRRPAVAVLLATWNGAARLQAQLDSFVAQTLQPALILVSDDGSTDDTRDIVRAFANAHPALNVTLLDGPRKGAAQNFLSLIRAIPEGIDYATLSDQDDVWLRDKLQRGVDALTGAARPDDCLLYCGRTWECNAELRDMRISRPLRRPAGFRNALVQNIASGNTIMLNRPAIKLAQAASLEARKPVVHDWWLYQIVTGAGGAVLFDHAPLLMYRQHEGNLIGANRGFQAKRKRLRFMLAGRLRRWNTMNIDALSASAHRLRPENRQTLEDFATGRNGGLWTRLAMIRRNGLYRQGKQGTLSLYLAAALRKL